MIIHYVDQFSRKSETFIYNLISKLNSSYEQLVITEQRLLETERPFARVLVLNGSTNFFSRVRRRLFDRYALPSKEKIKLVVGKNPESILIVHFLNNGIGALKIFAKLNQKIIIMCYGSDVNRITIKNKFALSAIKSINFNNNVKLIAVSNFLKSKLIKLGVNESKIAVYYPAYSASNLMPVRKSGVKKVVSVGRLSKEKGFEYIINAFGIISEKYPQIVLEIYGDGDLIDSLQALSIKVNANIIFKGYKPHAKILDALRDADLYIQPSVKLNNGTEEGLATSVLEAISMGLPCIVTNVGGMKEVVEDGYNGFVVAERSEIELSKAILKYCNDPSLIGIHSENAKLKASILSKQSDEIFDLVSFN